MILSELETPSLVLDRSRLEHNATAMRERLSSLGAPLRPHVKTAKSIDVLRTLSPEPGAITVSTLREAEYFAEHGVTDILYAVGIAPGKLEHVAALRRKGADIVVSLDSEQAARRVAAKGSEIGMEFPAVVEVDSDGHRAGVAPLSGELMRIAEFMNATEGISFKGLMTHAGESYNCRSTDEIRLLAEQERSAVVDSAKRLSEAGIRCEIVSVGSTPTATFAESCEGVTEVRAGVFLFQDLVMAGLGVCGIADIALSVLTSVIGHQRSRNWLITDAGWMALSRDRGTAKQKVDQGYGMVCDIEGRPLDDLIVSDTNQEQGIITRRDGGPLDFASFPIGAHLRILPNHACATAAQHESYHVVENGLDVSAVWSRFGGW